MPKFAFQQGSTSVRIPITVLDTTKQDGSGLTGLVYNSAGLAWSFWRADDGNAGATSVTLVSATRGTWTSGGFVEKDSTNVPGDYELGVPNAALAAGSTWGE